MTIGVLADTIFPAVGGNGRTLERLATALKTRGHRVVAYTARAAGGNPAPHGITVRAVRATRLPGFRLPARWALARPTELAAQFRRDDIAVLHVTTFYSPLGVAARRACARVHIPYLAHTQTQPEHALKHVGLSNSTSAVRLIYRYLVRRLEQADAVVVASARAGALLKDQGFTGNPVVLPNGLDLQFWSPRPAEPEFLRAQKLAGHPLVLSVSRLMKDKNLPLLLDGFRRLRVDVPHAVLAFLGEGPERRRLERAAAAAGLADAVRFPGWVEQPEALRAWYRAASVFVLPSTVEIQSLAILEAMACAVPVIVAEAPANLAADLVEDGRNGYRVVPGDGEGLARRLKSILTDAALKERLGSAGRARAEADHDLARVVEKLEHVYASLIRP